nr:thiol reductant ABC exporter subunit CydC [Schaalia suimastitidis]
MTRRDLARHLLRVARPVLPPLGISLIARCVALSLGIAMYGLAAWQILAHATQSQVAMPVWHVLWLMVAMALGKAFARYLEQFAGHWVAFRSLALLRNYFFDRLEPQAPAFTEMTKAGDLLSRVTKDVDRIEVFFAHTLVPITSAFIVPSIALGWIATVSPSTAMLLVPFVLLVGAAVPLLGGKASEKAATALRAQRGQLSHHVADSVQGIREVLAFAAQPHRHREMGAIEEKIARNQVIMGRWVAMRRACNQFFVAAALIAVAWSVGVEVAADRLDAATLGLLVGVTLGLFAPLLAVEDFAVDLDQAWASARRVFEVTEREPLVDDRASHWDSANCDGSQSLSMTNVSFTYPTSPSDHDATRPQVLHDVTVDIPAGKTTAIVGASGSGKSTLAALLGRTWDPSTGMITLGQTPLSHILLKHLRHLVAFAPQRPHLFNMSVRENLLLAQPDASDEELYAVLDAMALGEWIASEKDGLDTKIGEMGERLSGGQRQRLALARTLLRGSPILILDEATSQVDAHTEARIMAGLERLHKGTLVLVAHRISTVRQADQIIVMDAGHVVECGTWETLMEKGGAFAALAAREDEALAK